jgi:DNA-directed RNA polymerase specialized sigma24 family protein
LGQFASGRRKAERRYREFVHDGINKRTIWDDVKGQSILGERDFVDQLIDYVRGYEEAKEIPKGQRYVNRPSLGDIFKDTKRERGKRNREIADAVDRWGYSQKEVADHLGLHYSTISRLINEGNLKYQN